MLCTKAKQDKLVVKIFETHLNIPTHIYIQSNPIQSIHQSIYNLKHLETNQV